MATAALSWLRVSSLLLVGEVADGDGIEGFVETDVGGGEYRISVRDKIA